MEGELNNERKKPAEYPGIRDELLEREETDQGIRARSDNESFDAWDEWDRIDGENTEAMKRIVGEIGWPTVSKVGAKASHIAWLLVQHADHDPAFQKRCLDLMKAGPEGEVEKRDIAFLEDRICVNIHKPQVYGTQFHETRDPETRQKVVEYGPQPIEDFENIDERRAAVGLGPFEQYREEITRRYYPHLLDKE